MLTQLRHTQAGSCTPKYQPNFTCTSTSVKAVLKLWQLTSCKTKIIFNTSFLWPCTLIIATVLTNIHYNSSNILLKLLNEVSMQHTSFRITVLKVLQWNTLFLFFLLFFCLDVLMHPESRFRSVWHFLFPKPGTHISTPVCLDFSLYAADFCTAKLAQITRWCN